MKTAVIGAGLMGSAIAWDLARSRDVDSVSVADVDAVRLASLKKKVGSHLSVSKVNVLDTSELKSFLRGCDVAVSALPHGVVHPTDVAAVTAGLKLVNIAFEDEQMSLHARAMKSGALLIPGCGLAPGLSNILVAQGERYLGEAAEEGHILVGGLPQRPEPPLGYHLLFSVKGLVREYRSARVIHDGRVVEVKPFETIEKVTFPKPIGTLEAFYTDGLGSSVYSLAHLNELDEKTLRWPGHADRIKFLTDSGFFSDEEVRVDGVSVKPIDFTSQILHNVLTRGDPRDFTVLRVETIGKKNKKDGKRVKIAFNLLDYYDDENAITSMGRTTGFTAAIVARMVGSGRISGQGVRPPETLEGAAVERLVRELGEKGVRLQHTSRRMMVQ